MQINKFRNFSLSQEGAPPSVPSQGKFIFCSNKPLSPRAFFLKNSSHPPKYRCEFVKMWMKRAMSDCWSNIRSTDLPQSNIQQQFFRMLLGPFFLGITVSATTKMLTEQQPLQTAYSQLSLKRRPLGLPQSVYLREMSRCPFYQGVH